jgi:molecular chaperone GrpE (heat shock protein)
LTWVKDLPPREKPARTTVPPYLDAQHLLMEDDYVPPSQRPIAELRNRAAEYRRMAETARIKDTAAGLLRLADRFDDLADQRERLRPVA